jgi:hypothetical protein
MGRDGAWRPATASAIFGNREPVIRHVGSSLSEQQDEWVVVSHRIS